MFIRPSYRPLPDEWEACVVMDWSDGFWDKMAEKYDRVLELKTKEKCHNLKPCGNTNFTESTVLQLTCGSTLQLRTLRLAFPANSIIAQFSSDYVELRHPGPLCRWTAAMAGHD